MFETYSTMIILPRARRSSSLYIITFLIHRVLTSYPTFIEDHWIIGGVVHVSISALCLWIGQHIPRPQYSTFFFVSSCFVYECSWYLCRKFWLVNSSKTAGAHHLGARLRYISGQSPHSIGVQEAWQEKDLAFDWDCFARSYCTPFFRCSLRNSK